MLVHIVEAAIVQQIESRYQHRGYCYNRWFLKDNKHPVGTFDKLRNFCLIYGRVCNPVAHTFMLQLQLCSEAIFGQHSLCFAGGTIAD